jgi:serine/threonine-protein kinase
MLAAKLEHPNIITVHDIGISEDESPFFTMELKMGDNLEQFLTKHGPKGRRENEWCSPTEMCQMFLKVCDAMSYAHSLGVLHLDLKPENIQIGHHGEVLVCDWGLGKIMSQQDQDLEEDFDDLLLNPDLLNNMTISGKIKGTPGYMAPEQVEKNISFDERTDIYALGCLLYAMLCGEAPMKGSVDEILEKTRQSNGLCPHLLCPEMNVPPSLDAIVTKATRKDPSDRYEAIDDLVKDI